MLYKKTKSDTPVSWFQKIHISNSDENSCPLHNQQAENYKISEFLGKFLVWKKTAIFSLDADF